MSESRERQDRTHPENIGPYRILDVLGSGGMGVVYRAEQTEPIRRTVALKQIRLGMDTERVIARFEAERRTLALMEHPFIARVLDAGAGESGRPYFVLELVDGVPITEFCAAGNLGVEERVRLFLDVLSAVQHAHGKGIIHRDLKPSNILVSRVDGRAVPKVIDFGVAKAVEESQDSSGAMTLEGQVLGTPDYMSPEQAGLHAGMVDTRTDIYALGVVFYELLTGALPLSRAFPAAGGPGEAARILATEDPPLPSERTVDARNLAGYTAPQMAGLRGRLRGDLDAVALRALAREPADRYQTADAFADDLRRHLAHEPVLAARAGAGYRMRKFARRHRTGVTVALLLGLTLAAGAVGTGWQAVRAIREREVAQQRLAAVRQLASELVFEVDDRVRALPGSAPVREYIAVTGARLMEAIAEDPEAARELGDVLAGSFYRLGDVQLDIGHTGEALTSYARAVHLAESGLQERPGNPALTAVLARTCDRAGRALSTSGQAGKAAASHERAAELFATLAAAYPESLDYRSGLAQSLSVAGFIRVRLGEADVAAEQHRRAIAVRQAILTDHPEYPDAAIDFATAQAYLAESLEDLGSPDQALALYRSAADGFDAAWRKDPSDLKALNRLAVVLGAVGAVLSSRGESEEAVRVLTRSLELRREQVRLNPEVFRYTRDLVKGLIQLGDAFAEQGDGEEARRCLEEGVVTCRALIAQDPDDTTAPRYLVILGHALARLDIDEGRWDEAERRLLAVRGANRRLMEMEPEREDHASQETDNLALTGELHERLAGSPGLSLSDRRDHLSAASEAYEASRKALLAMQDRGLLPPSKEVLIGDRVEAVARCESLRIVVEHSP